MDISNIETTSEEETEVGNNKPPIHLPLHLQLHNLLRSPPPLSPHQQQQKNTSNDVTSSDISSSSSSTIRVVHLEEGEAELLSKTYGVELGGGERKIKSVKLSNHKTTNNSRSISCSVNNNNNNNLQMEIIHNANIRNVTVVNSGSLISNVEYPLHQSIQKQNFFEVLQFLRKHPKANLNERNDELQTPLHVACSVGSRELAELLLHSQRIAMIELNAVDINGWSALHYAINSKNILLVKFLLQFVPRINVNLKTRDGTSALHYLVRILPSSPELQSEYLKVLSLLLNSSVELDYVIPKTKETALMQATRLDNFLAVQLLVSKDVNIHLRNVLGETALFEAVRNSNINLVKLFIDRGADPFVSNLNGQTIAEIADAQMLSLLYSHKIIQPSLENQIYDGHDGHQQYYHHQQYYDSSFSSSSSPLHSSEQENMNYRRLVEGYQMAVMHHFQCLFF